MERMRCRAEGCCQANTKKLGHIIVNGRWGHFLSDGQLLKITKQTNLLQVVQPKIKVERNRQICAVRVSVEAFRC